MNTLHEQAMKELAEEGQPNPDVDVIEDRMVEIDERERSENEHDWPEEHEKGPLSQR